MIDTHSHIYLDDFKDGFTDMLQRARDAGVGEVYLPNIDVHSIANLKQVARQNPHCKPMMGLHPGSVKADYQQQLAEIFRELNENKYCAVGEIGMDLYWDKTFVKEQMKAFGIQIEKAKELGLPIVIHCRDAFDEVFEILEAYFDEDLYGIFHCFTGNAVQARRAISLNMKLGIGGVITFKNSGLDAVIKDIELKHLVLETDAPYLAPAPFRGKTNEPSYLKYIAAKIAEVKETSLEEVDRVTTINAREIFKNC